MAGEGDKSIDLDKYYQLTQIDEYVVRYVKVGNGPTPIFGFPGLLGSVKVGFGTLIDLFLKDQDKFTFYSWDQPGYYGSQPPSRKVENISFAHDVELCAKFLTSLGHPKYTLIGWSAGSQLCLLFASKYPEMVERMMVWGAWDRLAGRDLTQHIWFRDLNNLEPKFLEETIGENGRGREGYETHWHAWMDMVQETYSGEYDQVTWLQRFEPITCPVLIIWGQRDTIVSLDQAKYLHKHIPNSRLEVIPKAPHWIQTVYPSLLYKNLVDFINGAGWSKEDVQTT